MFILANVEKGKFIFDLSMVAMSEDAGELLFTPIHQNQFSIISEEYDSTIRAQEVFDDIVKSLEEGKVVYHLPEE